MLQNKKMYMTIFVNGRQKRVPRPQLIEGLSVDEFIAHNADPIWLHQNEMWELMPSGECDGLRSAVVEMTDPSKEEIHVRPDNG